VAMMMMMMMMMSSCQLQVGRADACLHARAEAPQALNSG
jgi:hypothetical protein